MLQKIKNTLSGNISYTKFELVYLEKEELKTINLTRLEFELLIDNKIGQLQLVKREGGNEMVDLICSFRTKDNYTFTINFNCKEVKIYSFTSDITPFNSILKLNYKKVYTEFLKL